MRNPSAVVSSAALFLSLACASSVSAQTAPMASADRIVLSEPGQRESVLLSGRTDAFTGATVVDRGGRPVRGLTVELGRNSGRELPLTITHDGAAAGMYELDLVHARGTTRVRLDIVVEAANRPPAVTSADAPASVMEGEAVALSVAASDDRSVVEIRASWPGGQTSVQTGGGEVMETLTLQGLEPGVHQVAIEAIDDRGEVSEVRTVDVTVEAANSAPVVTSVDAPASVMEGEAVEVTVSATDDGGLAEIRAAWPGGSATVPTGGTAAEEVLVVEGFAAGVYDVTVEVVDDQGVVGDAHAFTVEVVGLGVASAVLAPASVPAGERSTLTVTLNAPAPSDAEVVLLGGGAPVLLPASVTVAAGQTSASVLVPTEATDADASVTFVARHGSSQAEVTLTVTAPVLPTPSQLDLGSPSIGPGQQIEATAHLSAPAPAGGVALQVGSSSPDVRVPREPVVVPEGATEVSFVVLADDGAAAGQAFVTVTLDDVVLEETIAVVVDAGMVVHHVGAFEATLAVPALEPGLEPVSLHVGTFEATLEPPPAPGAAFEPVVLHIGGFEVTLRPPEGGG